MRTISHPRSIRRLCLTMALLALLLSTTASAQSPARQLAQLGGASYAIATTDSLVCAGMGPKLVLLSQLDSHWLPVGSLSMPDVVRGLVIDGDYAYVAAGAHGLRVVSLANPQLPTEISFLSGLGTAMAVAVSAGHAYVGTAEGTVAAIDISSPMNPALTHQVELSTEFATEPEVVNLAVADSYAYVAAKKGALRVLSLSDPANPTEVGAYYVLYEALDVAVDGAYAYVAAADDGLKILSLSNPEQPTLVTTEPIGEGIAHAVSILPEAGAGDSYAYVAAQDGGLWVVSITDPHFPVTFGPYPTSGPDARDVVIQGDRLYVADGAGGVDAFDMSQPSQPSRLNSYTSVGDALDVATAGNHIFAAGGVLGLHSLSYQGGQLTLLDTLDTDGIAFSVSLSNGYAYVADGQGGLRIISTADPTNLREVSSRPAPGIANGVAVQDGHAYVAAGEAGLWIVSVSDPAHPSTVVTVDTPGEALNVVASGDYAYVADGDRGLCVISIADPAAAHRIGEGIETPGRTTGLALAGQYAYLADGETGIIVVDISDPAQPEVVGARSIAGRALDVALLNDYAYVAAEAEGLQVLSIASPIYPEPAGSLHIPGSSTSVGFDPANDMAFVAARDGGLVALSTKSEYHVYLPIIFKNQ